MSASATLPVASPAPDPDRAGPDMPPRDVPPRTALPRVGRLLRIVRRLVAFGTNLLTTLQAGASAERQALTMLSFGTKDLALIIARIKCGLLRAAGLEVRLNGFVKRGRDMQPAPWRLSIPRARTDAPDDAPQVAAPPARTDLLALLPSAEEIAEQVRTRPLGVIICDICRDLGLSPRLMDGVLWRELTEAVAECGLSLTRLLRDSGKPSLGEQAGQADIKLTARLELDEMVAAAGQPP
jgi:hypothetical protein